MVVGVLVDIEGHAGDDGGQGDDEAQGGEQGKEPAAPASIAIEQADDQDRQPAEIESGQAGGRFQPHQFRRHPLGVGSEQGPAAGGDEVRLQAGKKLPLDEGLGQGQGGDEQQQGILGPHQGVIRGLVVHPIKQQPGGAGEEQGHLEVQGGPAPGVGVQHPGGAHGADELGRKLLGVVDEEQQGQQVGAEDPGHQGGDQVGAPLQIELPLAAAVQVPVAQDAQGKTRRHQQESGLGQGGQGQGEEGGGEGHERLRSDARRSGQKGMGRFANQVPNG